MVHVVTIVFFLPDSGLLSLLKLFGVGCAFYFSYIFLALVHELGHFLIGLACGFQTVEFRVSIFIWRKGWSVKASWFNFLTAWVKMLPISEQGLRFRFLSFILAGPIANLVFALLLYLLILKFEGYTEFLGIWIISSILLGLGNLIPFRRGKLSSDGMKALSTIFNGKVYQQVRFGVIFRQEAFIVRELMRDGRWEEVKALAEKVQLQGKGLMTKEAVKAVADVVLLADRTLQAKGGEGENIVEPDFN